MTLPDAAAKQVNGNDNDVGISSSQKEIVSSRKSSSKKSVSRLSPSPLVRSKSNNDKSESSPWGLLSPKLQRNSQKNKDEAQSFLKTLLNRSSSSGSDCSISSNSSRASADNGIEPSSSSAMKIDKEEENRDDKEEEVYDDWKDITRPKLDQKYVLNRMFCLTHLKDRVVKSV